LLALSGSHCHARQFSTANPYLAIDRIVTDFHHGLLGEVASPAAAFSLAISSQSGRNKARPPDCQTGGLTLAAHLRRSFQDGVCKVSAIIGPPWPIHPTLGFSPLLVIDQAHSQTGSPPMVVSSTILDGLLTAA
jgi:hypothetical protein